MLLIFYALPNGNTTGQTIGRLLKPGDDWHFDIQHIGAQTRFLRTLVTNRTIVIAYLEAESRAGPHGAGSMATAPSRNPRQREKAVADKPP